MLSYMIDNLILYVISPKLIFTNFVEYLSNIGVTTGAQHQNVL
jgi:hypothetical protein